MIYNIGQKFVVKEDTEVEGCFGTKKTVKKGTGIYVTASQERPMVIYDNGNIQMLPEDAEVKGFSAEGISEFICNYLFRRFNIQDMLEDYDQTKREFQETIIEALEELSFYNHEGNLS